MISLRKLSPAAFILTLLCFALPFIEGSCGGSAVVRLSGAELAIGTSIEQSDPFSGRRHTQKVAPEPLAIVAALCAIVGLLSVLRRTFSDWATAAIAAAGEVALYALRMRLDRQILEQGQGILQLTYLGGYWLACLLFLFLSVAYVYFAIHGPTGALDRPTPVEPAPPSSGPPAA